MLWSSQGSTLAKLTRFTCRNIVVTADLRMAKAFVETTIIPAVKPNENTFNQLLRPASHKCNIMQYICEVFLLLLGYLLNV